ncbi:galectin-4-like isoform X2 [Phlebotomus papatasi]|uniref:galectin-4-like isoform X2 n=1 Tax=Phlebotomus papatasi TaxID=29031 RepID=UPI00248461C8|nr:galectin-4-like isoform X2 [Phlebotomus papatasi]
MNIQRRLERTFYNNFMATIPVYNPLSPFLGLIPGGFRVGQMIRIKGVLNYYGHRFQINIQSGPALRPRDDVGLHMSIRPQEHVIARNTMTNNTWGSEERHGGCPLNPGQTFDILILAEHSCYKVAINGIHFCAFNHRLSLARMQFISIDGEVTIHSITQEGDTSGGAPIAHPMPVPAHTAPPYTPTPYQPPGGAYGGAYGNPYGAAAPTPPPPPPPYSPYPHSGYGQPGVIYQPKKKSNKALKYAAGAAGVGAGIGLTALAISSIAGGGGGDDDGGDDGGDFDVDF